VKRSANYLYRVAGENENTLTELLINLMSKKYIRDLLLNFLHISDDIISSIHFEHLSTQYTISDSKRPDIVIKNDESVIFIENKIYIDTPLMESQTTTYPDHLIKLNKKNKKLIFLIPKDYTHEIEIKTAKQKYDSTVVEDFITIIYWSDVISQILEYNLNECDSATMQSIDFMINTLNLNTTKKVLTKGEIIVMYDKFTLRNVNTLFLKLKNYTQSVSEKILKEYKGKLKFKKTNYEHFETHIGTWIESVNGGVWPLFIGCSFNNDNYMYHVRINKSLIKNEPNAKEDEFYFEKEWYFFEISKDVFANDENVVEELFLFTKKLLDKYC